MAKVSDIVRDFQMLTGETSQDWQDMLALFCDRYNVDDVWYAVKEICKRPKWNLKQVEDICKFKQQEREKKAGAIKPQPQPAGGVSASVKVDGDYLTALFACQQTSLAERIAAQNAVDKRFGRRWLDDPLVSRTDANILRESSLHLSWLAATQGWVRVVTEAGLAWVEQRFAKHLAPKPTWSSFEQWKAEVGK